jgi:hypothetical protein
MFYRRWLRFDWVDKNKDMPREAVLDAFRDLQKRLAKVSPTNDSLAELAHTTAALLASVKKPKPDGLRWEQLRQLLVDGIDYVAVFRELGKHSWSEMSETERFRGGAFKDEAGETVAFSPYRTEVFISYVGWLANFLSKEVHDPDRDIQVGRKIQDNLGPSTEKWLGLTFNDEAVEAKHVRRSEKFPRVCLLELNLRADNKFSADLLAARKFVTPVFGKRRWYYDYETNAVVSVTSDGDILPWTGRSVPAGILDHLRELCLRWCLASVSNATGSAKAQDLYITIHRPRVSARTDNMGIDVFIPRFYKYNDIHNYGNTDFRPLLVVMDRIFPSGRLQLMDTTMIEEAKDYMVRLIKRGDTPASAWDKTREKFCWSVRTATDYLGSRPKR